MVSVSWISICVPLRRGWLRRGADFVSRRAMVTRFEDAPTQIASPVGNPISKGIGPAGGTISSADGRITLTVPKDAVSESVQFSIQPISNTAQDGIGHAYRLEPGGRAFVAPLSISSPTFESIGPGSGAPKLGPLESGVPRTAGAF